MMKIHLSESFWKVMGLLSSIFSGIFFGTQRYPSFEDLSSKWPFCLFYSDFVFLQAAAE